MRYFDGITNLDDLRQTFRKLCLKLHPDKGGSAEEFKAMYNEYQTLLESKPWEYFRDAKTSYSQESNLAEMLRKLMKVPGIIIEVCGSWLWVGGNTYGVKEALKELGLKFSGKKKRWYWANELTRERKRGYYTMEKIYQRFGVHVIESEVEDSGSIA